MPEVYWMPVQPLRKGAPRRMRIGGMATLDDVIDLDQQLLQHTGVIDCLGYLERFGKVNWNHGDEPKDLLGDIVKAQIRTHEGKRGLWIEADLNPPVEQARDAYNFMQGGGRLGFSVQGVTLDLQKATHNGFPVGNIRTAFISQVALTPEPKNYETFAQVLKSLQLRAIKKALTAGAGTDHAAFAGGRALTAEHLGSRDLVRLAGHFRRIHGSVPCGTDRFTKALQSFCKGWGLTPEHGVALAEFMRKRSS